MFQHKNGGYCVHDGLSFRVNRDAPSTLVELRVTTGIINGRDEGDQKA